MCKDDEGGGFYQEKYYSFTLGSCLCVKMMREEGSIGKNTIHLPWEVVYV